MKAGSFTVICLLLAIVCVVNGQNFVRPIDDFETVSTTRAFFTGAFDASNPANFASDVTPGATSVMIGGERDTACQMFDDPGVSGSLHSMSILVSDGLMAISTTSAPGWALLDLDGVDNDAPDSEFDPPSLTSMATNEFRNGDAIGFQITYRSELTCTVEFQFYQPSNSVPFTYTLIVPQGTTSPVDQLYFYQDVATLSDFDTIAAFRMYYTNSQPTDSFFENLITVTNQISGTVFRDCNEDTVFQAGEQTPFGINVDLVDCTVTSTIITSTTTANDGTFSFGAADGCYKVCVDITELNVNQVVPAGYTPSSITQIAFFTAADFDVNGCTNANIIINSNDSADNDFYYSLPVQIACPAADTADCSVQGTVNGNPGNSGLLDAVAFDCNGAMTTTFSDATQPCGAVTRTFFATSTTPAQTQQCQQSITFTDNVAPTFTVPADILNGDCTNVNTSPAVTGDATNLADNCQTPTISDTTVQTNPSCPLTFERTFTATDNCGNVNTQTQVISYPDNTAPTFTTPADANIQCTDGTTVGDTGDITNCVDDCNSCDIGSRTVNDNISNNGCSETITRTFTVPDTCGNVATGVQTIVATDTQNPVITLPAAQTIDCNDDTSTLSLGDATATDDCTDPIFTSNSNGPITGDGCTDTFARTFSATDNCGNTATGTVVYTLTDTTAPTFSVQPSVSINCLASTQPTAIPNGVPMNVVDDCNPTVPFTFSDTTTSTSTCVDTVDRTFTIADACGNASTGTQTITITDNISPTFDSTPTSPVTVECIDDTTTAALGTATATDSCTSASVSFADTPQGPDACSNTVLRTFTATDDCGNTATFVQNIVIEDNIAPVITVSDGSVACGDDTSSGAPGVPAATAVDDCQGTVTNLLTQSTTQVSNDGCTIVYNRVWSVNDGCGNVATVTQQISSTDAVAPFFTFFPDDATVDLCGGDTSPASTGTATGDDACTFGLVTFSDSTTGSPCVQTTSRTWTVTDQCGLTDVNTQTITAQDVDSPVVVPSGFQTSVVINCAAVVDTTSASLGVPVFSDCQTLSAPTENDVIVNPDNCNQQVERTFTVSDGCGNPATSVTQDISIIDNGAPVITIPAGTTVECGGDTSIASTGNASATDSCNNSGIVIANTDGPITGTCPQGFSRTFTATDVCGNVATGTQFIQIADTNAPALTIPADTAVDCNVDFTNTANTGGDGSAIDTCTSLTVPVTFVDGQLTGNCAAQTFARTFTAVEQCNSVSDTQIITVVDTTAPTVTFPAATTIECNECSSPTNGCTGAPSGTDDCNSFLVSNTDSAVVDLDGCSSQFTRTFTVTDGCSNDAVGNQVITITDTVAPTIIAPFDITIDCQASTAPSNTGTVNSQNVNDICSTATVTFSDSAPTGDLGCDETFTRTWFATDACSNVGSDTQVIRIRDTTAPVFDPSTDPIIDTNCNDNTFTYNLPAPTDDCNTFTTAFVDGPVTAGCTSTFTRTYTATDACGNARSFVQTWNIVDTDGPSFTSFPTDVSVGCNDPTNSANTGFPTATDICDPQVDISETTVSSGQLCTTQTLQYTRTFTAIDNCGLTTSETQVITVNVDELPVITPPADQSVDCDESTSTAALGTATFTNPCNVQVTLTFSDALISTDNCITLYDRTWSASDACGNNAVPVTQRITVTDQTPPVFSCFPEDVTLPCDGDTDPLNTGVPCAADGCNLAVCDITFTDNLVQNANDGACEGDYILTRSWFATDICGLTQQQDQIITILIQTQAEPCEPEPCAAQDCPLDLCPTTNCDCCASPLRACTPVPCNAVNCSPVNCNAVDCLPCPASSGNYYAPVPFCDDGTCTPNIQFVHRDDDDNDDGNTDNGPVGEDDLYNYFLDDDDSDDDDWVSGDDDRFAIIYVFENFTDDDDDNTDDDDTNDDDDNVGIDDNGFIVYDDDDFDDDSAMTIALSSIVLLASLLFLFI